MQRTVRLACPEDADGLVRLNREFNGVVDITAEEVSRSLRLGPELVAVAILDGVLSGFACAQSFTSFCYRERQAEITELFVMETARGQGLARELLLLLEEHLRRQGVQSIKVITGGSNEAALKTYVRSGYIPKEHAVLYKELGSV
ncbi:GCN5-like N-acetyltransferase [Paenibacillus mucilaginosus 3016]|uniref:GCN5-like N-acetyltransferase n=1 Tax=Paenibacillus mucilaginosus 3016 TaxID=1116391 RepID=H6NRM7_9BACL|nr:GNAT family N-acetyltransferase [Paenibacillus mucilaginosus]AFC27309.1 GCN5-like N-acetyltransferase [Paenibacillus mucilaginosus 3016]